MVQGVNMLLFTPNDLNLILGSHIKVEGDSTYCPLTFTLTHNHNIIVVVVVVNE